MIWNFLGHIAFPDYSAEQVKLFPFLIPLAPVNTGALRVSYRSYLTGYNSGPVGPVVPSWP